MKLLFATRDTEVGNIIAAHFQFPEKRWRSWRWLTSWDTDQKYIDELRKLELIAVFQAKDETTILGILEQEKPEAILIDSDILRLDVSIIERLRQKYDKVTIIITGYIYDEQFLKNGLTLGANDYITKPFGPRQLRARIKRAIEGNL
jgi:DNA-binding response OmpR family regulator